MTNSKLKCVSELLVFDMKEFSSCLQAFGECHAMLLIHVLTTQNQINTSVFIDVLIWF